MELKKITEEVNALTEQFPCFWSQFEIDDADTHGAPSHTTSLSHAPFPSGSHSSHPFSSSSSSHHPSLMHYAPSTTSHYEMQDISSSSSSPPSEGQPSHTNAHHSDQELHSQQRQQQPQVHHNPGSGSSSGSSSGLSLESIQLHHIRCRYIERGKHFELSWSCPTMANYTWLVDPSDMDPRCLNRIREGTTGRHGRNIERTPALSGDTTTPTSPFRLKAEIGIDTSEGWVPLQQCCPQCTGPLVLFASSSTRMSEQGHGRIVAQVHFTKTHGGRAATCRVGLRLKCVTADLSSSSPSSAASASSSVQHEVEAPHPTVNINPIVLPSPHPPQQPQGQPSIPQILTSSASTLHHQRPPPSAPSSSSTSSSLDTSNYVFYSNWTELPFKRHENKKRKNPFSDDHQRRTEPKRRVPSAPTNRPSESDLKRSTRSRTASESKLKQEKDEQQAQSFRECRTFSVVPSRPVNLHHYGSQFAPLTLTPHQQPQPYPFNPQLFKTLTLNPKEPQSALSRSIKGPIAAI